MKEAEDFDIDTTDYTCGSIDDGDEGGSVPRDDQIATKSLG